MPAVDGRPALDDTFGALLIGAIVAAILWGIACMQTFEYVTLYPRDPIAIKMTVFSIMILATTHQALLTHTTYSYLVTEYGNPQALTQVIWSIKAHVLPAVLIGLIVQIFFAWRVWILSGKKVVITAVLLGLIAGNFALGIVYFASSWHIKTYEQLKSIDDFSRLVNALGAAADLGIAATLLFLLQRFKTGLSRSDAIINQLMLYSLNTGFATSIFALAALISISVAPENLVYVLFYACVTRVYANSFLATLNARQKIRETSHPGFVTFEQTFMMHNIGTGPQLQAANPAQFNVQIDTETEVKYDEATARTGTKDRKPSRINSDGFELSVFGSEV